MIKYFYLCLIFSAYFFIGVDTTYAQASIGQNFGDINFTFISTSGPTTQNPSVPIISSIIGGSCDGARRPFYVVQWNPSTNTQNYTVLYDSGGAAIPVDTITQSASPQSTFLVPENNQYYYITIRANGLNGQQADSVRTYAGPSGNCVPPTLDVAENQCPPSFQYGNRLNWSTNTANLTSFSISRSTSDPTTFYGINPGLRSYTDTAITAGSNYSYFIQSYGLTGQASPASNVSAPVLAGYCDTTPPTLNYVLSSLNGPHPNGCFAEEDNMIWPRPMDVIINDNSPFAAPPPASGVNANNIQVHLLNHTTGQTLVNWESVDPARVAANTWRYNLSKDSPQLMRNHYYTLSIRATDNTGHQGLTSYSFYFRISCLDWIQTTGGNVHSEGNINAPGGP